MKYYVYCDLDGVLVDFDKGVDEICPGLSLVDDSTLFWKAFYKNVRDEEKFWANLDWTKDGKKLWKYIKKFEPIILSAHTQRKIPCTKGKLSWIKKNLGIKYSKTAIICYRKEKQLFAGEDRILIDDSKDNIIKWINNGGIGIRHRSANKTISELKRLGIFD